MTDSSSSYWQLYNVDLWIGNVNVVKNWSRGPARIRSEFTLSRQPPHGTLLTVLTTFR
jgi:hypothetical protein